MQKIIIVDFGSQHTQLIARKVREMNVYSEIHPFNNLPKMDDSVIGLVLSDTNMELGDGLRIDSNIFEGDFPILGIRYGANQIIEYMKDGKELKEGLPTGLSPIYKEGELMGFRGVDREIFGAFFSPEFEDSKDGFIENFIVNVCKSSQDWTPEAFVVSTIEKLRKELGDDKVVLGLSGGVDSSVAAVLLHRAIGSNLHCIFVDNGLLRKNEFELVLESYKGMGLNVIGVDAKKEFLNALSGLSDPEEKRKAIGSTFIDIFDSEANKIKDVKWLAQGTIYPDIIESVSIDGVSLAIKSHHNVGGLPKQMKLKIVEPLKTLFKDEVRKVGKALLIRDDLISRHPFPGPGLAIRILSDITKEKVSILQEVDHIFIEGLREFGLYDEVWQAGAILLPVRSVGVSKDERTYENAVALRAVQSSNGMTAEWCKLPYEFLEEISNRIINNVDGVNRVVYDISSKPPATIEWE